MIRRSVLLTAVAAVALVSHGALAEASGGWKSTQRILGKKKPISELEIAAGNRNRAVLAYNRGRPRSHDFSGRGGATSSEAPRGSIYAARQKRSGRFRRPRRLSGATRHNYDLELAVAADGTALAAWLDRRNRVTVASRPPGQRWRRRSRLSGPISADPIGGRISLAIAADGSAIVTWLGDGQIASRIRVGNGAWRETTVHLQREGPAATTGHEPSVDIVTGGDAVVLWAGRCPLRGPKENAAAAFADAGVFGAPVEIGDSKCPADGVDVALAPSGRAAAMLSGRYPQTSTVRIAGGAGGVFDPAEVVSGDRPSGFGSLAVGEAGTFRALWSVGHGAKGPVMGWVSADPPTGTRRRVDRRRARGSAQLALGCCGGGLAAWQQPRSPYRIMASPLGPGGSFRRPERVSWRLPRGGLVLFDIAVDTAGWGHLAWSKRRSDGQTRGIWVRRREAL